MKLVLDGKGSRYEQLARAIKSLILDGTLVPKSRLPSTLAAEQLISSRIGVGNVGRGTVCADPGCRGESAYSGAVAIRE
jgi:hypothetical protein